MCTNVRLMFSAMSAKNSHEVQGKQNEIKYYQFTSINSQNEVILTSESDHLGTHNVFFDHIYCIL